MRNEISLYNSASPRTQPRGSRHNLLQSTPAEIPSNGIEEKASETEPKGQESFDWSELKSETWTPSKSERKLDWRLARRLSQANAKTRFSVAISGTPEQGHLAELSEVPGVSVHHIAGEIWTADGLDNKTLRSLIELKAVKRVEVGTPIGPAEGYIVG